jgi:hypothetical protein
MPVRRRERAVKLKKAAEPFEAHGLTHGAVVSIVKNPVSMPSIGRLSNAKLKPSSLNGAGKGAISGTEDVPASASNVNVIGVASAIPESEGAMMRQATRILRVLNMEVSL